MSHAIASQDLSIEELRNLYPALQPLIGRATAGSGWAIEIIFTPTYAGIEKILKLSNVSALVTTNRELIQSSLEQEPEKCIFVTDRGVLQEHALEYHAIAFYVEKRANALLLFIDDCEINPEQAALYAKSLQKLSSRKMHLIFFAKQRQFYGGRSVCTSFAIAAAKAFHENPEFIQKTLNLNGLEDSSLQEGVPILVDKVPPPLDTMNESIGCKLLEENLKMLTLSVTQQASSTPAVGLGSWIARGVGFLFQKLFG